MHFPVVQPYAPAASPRNLAIFLTAVQSFQLQPLEFVERIEFYPYSTTWDAWASDVSRLRGDAERALLLRGARWRPTGVVQASDE